MALIQTAGFAVGRIGLMFSPKTPNTAGQNSVKKAVLKKTKVKRDNIVRNNIFEKKREEKRKRIEKESFLEAVESKGRSGLGKLLSVTDSGGIFQKTLDFIGILLLGWLVNKLPQILELAKTLVNRIKKLFQTLQSFIKNLNFWFSGLKDLVISNVDNWLNLDFSDQSGKVKKAMEDMDKSFKAMKNDVNTAFDIIRGKADGEPGEPPTPTNVPKEREERISKAVKFYKGKGFSDEGASYMVGNLLQESSLDTGAVGDNGKAFGLAQWRIDEASGARWKGFLKWAQDNNKNTGDFYSQLEYTIVEGERYQKGLSSLKGTNKKAIMKFIKAYEGYSEEGSRFGYGESILQNIEKYKSGAGDGRQARGANQTPAYQRAVAVGRALEGQGYRAWQHPDFNVHSGYTGSGRERVMRRSYNSYHNYGEALDYPMSHNSEAQLNKLAAYFRQNKSALGIAEILWKTSGHYDHLHVSFKGGGSIDKRLAGVPSLKGAGQRQKIVIIEEEPAPAPVASGGSGGGMIIIANDSLNRFMKNQLLSELAYT
jgi:hypothetical protein